MNTILKRVISLVLCFVLVAGYLPTGAFANETGETVAPVVTEETEAQTSAVTETTSAATEATDPSTEPSEEAAVLSLDEAEPSTEASEPAVIAVTGITLDRDALEVEVGAEPVTLTATVLPEDATDKSVTWTSSNEDVATVENGVVTFRQMGEATITAAAGEFSATCTVKVGEAEAVVYANDNVDYLFIATDRHTNTSILATMINAMEAKIGENELDYLALGGDMVGSGTNHPSYNSSTVLSEITGATTSLSATNVDIVAGIHDVNCTDSAGILLPYGEGGAKIFEGNKFYVYGVPESCISGGDEEYGTDDPESEANAFVTWANGSDIDKSKAIIVVSHYPLHVRRNDNDGAVYWYNALNKVAAGDDTTIDRNVAFFWGHNHTSESDTQDVPVYHVAPNGSITVEDGNGDASTKHTIYFTYANAGYLNSHSSATLVTITGDTITFDKYKSSSVSTTNSVDRVSTTPAVTLESLSVSGITEYYVGGTFVTPTVKAVYSDNSEVDITSECTFSGYDMSTAGTQTVTVTWGEETTTYTITVTAVLNSIAVTTEPTKTVYNVGEELDTTGMVVTGTYSDGTTAELTGWYTSTVDMTTAGEKSVTVYYYDNGITFNDSFTITVEEAAVTVPEGYVLSALTVDASNAKTDYYVGDALDISGLTVTATFTKEDATNLSYELEYISFLTETELGGYTLDDFNMSDGLEEGKNHEVKVTYTYGEVTQTDSYNICVWKKSVTHTDSSVTVDLTGDYGVTAVNVAESTNTNVATAIADVISGTYVAYDITLYFDDGYEASDATKTVTLPIPEGVTNPAVYYVSDNGTVVTPMETTVNTDGTVSFTTTHFSTYVVGENTTITVPDNETASGSNTTTTYNETEVYVLVSSISEADDYLIASGNSGTVNLLSAASSGVANNTATVVTATDEDGNSVTYIASPASAAIWTATANNSNWRLYNSSLERYLRYNSGLTTTGSSNNATSWYSDDNVLYYRQQSQSGGYPGSSSSYTYYYVNYDGGWTYDSSSSTTSDYQVYYYQKQTVSLPTTTTVTGTYTIDGADETVAAVKGATVDLTADLLFDGEVKSDVSEAATYEVYKTDSVNGDPLGVISGIDGNTVTLSGTVGKALVKVSYNVTLTVDGVETIKTVTDYITITTTTPDHFSIELHYAELTEVASDETFDSTATYYVYNDTTNVYEKVTITAFEDGVTYYTTPVVQGEEVGDEEVIALKGIEAGDRYPIWAVVKAYATADDTEGTDLGSLGDDLTWTVSDTSIATIDASTGVLTFTGTNYGTFTVTVAYEGADGKVITDTITISATESLYVVPGDGTNDFPEYPNEGAIRFDKTATAVGNFSETGLALVELSMTGVPYSTGSEIDVVLMLDMTGSMSDTAMVAAEEAAVAFVAQIVKNEDGTYNNNRVAVYAFNSSSSSPFELVSLGAISSDTELEAANTAIRTASDKQYSGGTPYDKALQKCQEVLAAAKTDGTGDDRQQFCVFMSDGGPTSYEYITNYDEVKAGTATEYTRSSASATGGSSQSDSNFATIATYTHEYYSTLMKDDGVTMFSVLTGLSADNYPNCATILENIASSSDNAYVVESGSETSAVTGALSSIAQKIVEAARNVTVEDKIGNDYSINFSLPSGVTSTEADDISDFYIQVVEYQLDSDKERTGDPTVKENVTFTTDSSGNLSVKSHTINGTSCGDSCTHVTITNNQVTAIDGTYFDYKRVTEYDADGNAIDAEYLTWKEDKISTTELALQYFAYLDNSAGTDTNSQVAAGTYYTNEYATLTYTNHLGNQVQQEFPVPSMTWKGAQVTYLFYLVNKAGQPVSRTGRVIPFAEAVYVTDPITEKITWEELENDYEFLATDLTASAEVPSVFKLYDEKAYYDIRAYETDGVDENVENKSYFQITGGTAAEIAAGLGVSDSTTVSTTTTKVFNTKAGSRYAEYGVYSRYAAGTELIGADGTNIETTKQADDIDYLNTTVAFAVVWEPELAEDTVVVDYGLDVVIDVIKNDNMAAGVVGVRTTAPSGIDQDNGTYTADKVTSVDVNIDTNNDTDGLKENKIGTATVENLNSVRFSQNNMQFTDPAVFYYEADVNFYNDEGELQTTSMYSKVTVIPATTIYYEDSFVDLTVWGYDTNGLPVELDEEWGTEGTTTSATQDEDRPGESKISADLDADNNYGYDSAYKTMSNYSLGSARKVNVNDDKFAEVQFTFYGTGFDVISLTSNTTGTISVDVYNGTNVTYSGTNRVKSLVVDTYYGYKQVSGDADGDGTIEEGELIWVVDTDAANSLYQVPVMKVEGLTYGQYTVVITAAYYSGFDHNDAGSYDFYLDAIRIYDPCGTDVVVDDNGTTDDTSDDTTVGDIYEQDGEGWPEYFEVRNAIIDAKTFESVDTDPVNGIVFIDGNATTSSISDYTSYGPNNETYLAAGQAIAFDLNATAVTGTSVAEVQLAVKTVGGAASIKVYSTDNTTALDADINTATDMYYDITDLNGKTIVIMNDGTSGIVSITNVKVTYTAEQTATQTTGLFMLSRSSVDAALATMSVEEEVPDITEPEEPVSTRLQAAVDAAKQLQEKDYTPKSFKALKTALKSAEKVLQDKNATEEKLEAALEALNAAVAALEVRPDTSVLQAAVDAAKKLKEKDYTSVSYKAVTTARKAAEKVLKDKNATQAQVDVALEALNAAVAALEAKADFTALKAAVNAAKKLKEKDYTLVSYKAVTAARKAAEKVMKDKNANQAAADAALEALNAAVSALEARANTAALKAAVNAAKKLKSKNYTAESFQALTTARKAAEKLMKDKNANQAMADEALAALNAAMDALVAKTVNN